MVYTRGAQVKKKKNYMTSKNCRPFKGEVNQVTKDPQVLGPNIQN